MHTKSLGTDAYLLGSILLYMAKEVLPETPEVNMGAIWAFVQTFYTTNRTACRLSRLTLSMVDHQPFPKLAAKAMETRHLLPAVESFLSGHLQGNAAVAWFHRLVQLSMGLDELVFSNKTMVLSVRERNALRDGIFEYNRVLSRMAWSFHQRGMAYCNFTVKNHYLCHIGVNAAKTGISPRLAFCYQGEDFMSVIKSLCTASGRGVGSALLIDKVVPKYLRGLDILLRDV